jgi:hypothetical protein
MRYERVPGSPEDHLGYPNSHTLEPLRLDLLENPSRYPLFLKLKREKGEMEKKNNASLKNSFFNLAFISALPSYIF